MFKSRQQAGWLLVQKLAAYKDVTEVVIFGIPRGGVVVAKVIAKALKTPLDIVVVKKIALSVNPELAVGAVGPRGVIYWDNKLCRRLGVSPQIKNQELGIKKQEIDDRESLLRGDRPYPVIKDKIVVVVDDGVATGATSIAAFKFIKKSQARKIILATPVIAKDTFLHIKRYFDEIITLEQPEDFYAVGQFYEDFPQVTDEEVKKLL